MSSELFHSLGKLSENKINKDSQRPQLSSVKEIKGLDFMSEREIEFNGSFSINPHPTQMKINSSIASPMGIKDLPTKATTTTNKNKKVLVFNFLDKVENTELERSDIWVKENEQFYDSSCSSGDDILYQDKEPSFNQPQIERNIHQNPYLKQKQPQFSDSKKPKTDSFQDREVKTAKKIKTMKKSNTCKRVGYCAAREKTPPRTARNSYSTFGLKNSFADIFAGNLPLESRKSILSPRQKPLHKQLSFVHPKRSFQKTCRLSKGASQAKLKTDRKRSRGLLLSPDRKHKTRAHVKWTKLLHFPRNNRTLRLSHTVKTLHQNRKKVSFTKKNSRKKQSNWTKTKSKTDARSSIRNPITSEKNRLGFVGLQNVIFDANNNNSKRNRKQYSKQLQPIRMIRKSFRKKKDKVVANSRQNGDDY